MREIKFRVWDKNNGEWLGESDPNTLTYKGFHLFGEVMYFQQVPPEVLSSIEINQFIGIKDNYMQDVYEGDILYVSSKRSRYVVEWVNEAARYILRPVLNTATQPTISKITGEGRVIGNIYENPELLEKL